jgi:hypothetical protein
MTWAQLCGDLCVALSACASVMLVIVTAERIRDPTVEAEQKAHALLRAWLSPEQAQQYNSQKHFDVIGSDTGKRYRIRHGKMMNVDELDSVGNRVCEWCFLPEGKLAAGDVMLAQKIALETFESQALAVANRSSSWHPDGIAAGHLVGVPRRREAAADCFPAQPPLATMSAPGERRHPSAGRGGRF